LADVAFNGLLPHINDKYASQEFESISQIASQMTEETQSYESKKPFQKKINYVEYSANDDSEEEQETVASAEWIHNSKKPVACPFGKKVPESYGFDITKVDKIFDLLLSEGLIKLKPYHKIPSEEELKHMKYCKWHNATSHDTNECKVFWQQIQMAFEQGKLKFETPKKTMKIYGHPFATNMVDVAKDKGSSQAKILTSSSAKKFGTVDPKAQIAADEVKGKGPLDKAECSSVPRRCVTSQMLLNKFQRDHERQQRREEEEHHEKNNWRCPLFVYCWEEGLTLPSAYDCPECNGQGSRSYKRPRHEPYRRERTPVHDRLGKNVSVHDRLWGRTMLHDPFGRTLPACWYFVTSRIKSASAQILL